MVCGALPGVQGRGLLDHQDALNGANGMQAGQGQSDVLVHQHGLALWLKDLLGVLTSL